MNRLSFFECFILVAFFLSGLAAFLIGGKTWLGYIFQAFLITIMSWTVRQVWLAIKDDLFEKMAKDRVYAEWNNRSHRLKGME